jgi:hypothetical protein
MLYAVIVAVEIAFWTLLAGGLYVRYALDRPRAGGALLVAAGSTAAGLAVAAGVDLANGATAGASHVIAAVAVAYTVVYARRHVAKADRFVRRRLGREVTEEPRAPKATRERAGWYRHARMWAIGVPLLAAGYLIADEGDALAAGAGIWTVILAIDFLVSFSYSLGARSTNPGGLKERVRVVRFSPNSRRSADLRGEVHRMSAQLPNRRRG